MSSPPRRAASSKQLLQRHFFQVDPVNFGEPHCIMYRGQGFFLNFFAKWSTTLLSQHAPSAHVQFSRPACPARHRRSLHNSTIIIRCLGK